MALKESVPVTITATTAHRQFGELVRRAFSGKEHFIVEKDGLPVVAIISMAEYEELLREREIRLKQFQSAAKAIGEEYERLGLTEEEVMHQLEEAKREVYEEYYGDKSTT